ncbi:hypothetical protein PTSG_07882 [Salpingoeca rosetta]|uniref:Thioredoxin domain-containing protein n=1 Tax=Salpingoeca rosetta (strain ATCC 50818 / BSB-021) TaxID=946362 RepID=F2UGL4_SALR5|nr:uncharacterized protein PTSG_07882 [Salpingoeca rosetta]EGD75764.1 hypothetical protein PTSG_07882 [Salpingoeca rosetta]|eukprot:XP_004991685.1 hypothetical protein PTSG_07882 [Salpingoeca rosetta]
MATRSLMVTAAVTLLLVVAVALTSPASVRAASDSSDDSTSNVVVLTDETFEHDTQISSGATTGDWFIKFYAPWCGFCKAIAPVWDELADKVKESNVNIAKVDCTKNRLTCERFGVRGYPSLFFFHNGQIYKYNEAAVRVQQAKQEQAMQQKHKQDKKKGESGGNKDDDEQEDEDAGDKAAVSGGDARKGGARRRRAEQ